MFGTLLIIQILKVRLCVRIGPYFYTVGREHVKRRYYIVFSILVPVRLSSKSAPALPRTERTVLQWLRTFSMYVFSSCDMQYASTIIEKQFS